MKAKIKDLDRGVENRERGKGEKKVVEGGKTTRQKANIGWRQRERKEKTAQWREGNRKMKLTEKTVEGRSGEKK